MRAFQLAAIIAGGVQVSAEMQAKVTIPGCEAWCKASYPDVQSLVWCLESVVAPEDKCKSATINFKYTKKAADALCTDKKKIPLSFADFAKDIADLPAKYTPQHVLKDMTLGYKVAEANAAKCTKVTTSTVAGDDICTATGTVVKYTTRDLKTNIKVTPPANTAIAFSGKSAVNGILTAIAGAAATDECKLDPVSGSPPTFQIETKVTLAPATFKLSDAKVEFNSGCVVDQCAQPGQKTPKQIQTCLDNAAKKRGCESAKYTRTFHPAGTEPCVVPDKSAPMASIDISALLEDEQSSMTSRPETTSVSGVYFSKLAKGNCDDAVLKLGEVCLPGTTALTSTQSDKTKLNFMITPPVVVESQVDGSQSSAILVTFKTKTTGCSLVKDEAGDKLTLISTFSIENVAPSSASTHFSLAALLTASLAVLTAF